MKMFRLALDFSKDASGPLLSGLYSYRFDSETVRSSGCTLTVVGGNEQVCRPLRGARDV
jgi:hypothetical protein